MEDKKANIIATISIIALLIVIITARVTLKLSKTFYLIAGVDISLILAVICFLVIRRRYNRERKILVSKYVSEGRELRIEYSFLRKVAGVPTKFKLEDLEEATDGFRIQIGKGGSGSVFKGVLKDGSQVAVKRIEGEEKGEREFRSEKKKLEYFPRIVNQKMRERKVMEIVDERVEAGDEGQVMKLVCVALWCLQEKAKNRPDMAMVIEMLEGRVPVSEPPDSQLVVVDLLAAGDDDDATTGVRRVVETVLLSPSASSQHCLLSEMSISGGALGSGRILGRAVEFGKTHVVRPKGKHQATIVWLHGLGDNGSSWSQLLETLPLPNIKWICPTAPSQPISLFGGFPSTAWFDVVGINEDGPDDVEGLDVAAAHVANLLSNEPSDIKLGVGGFSMGAGTSLYSATCFALGKYGNGNPYPINLSTAIGLSGWLPCAKTLAGKLEEEQIKNRAALLPILVCHGKGDDVVPYKFGEKSSEALISHGFKKTTFKAYSGLGHYTIPQEMDELCAWLTSNLSLQG
ncbi:hypothetical protein IGI04_005071 [Brassica rapa subsp. trilocularis]|uniref:Phospholipase/carboxylesterase/thioesterase domain-containing protein n=1 Tax=Brassica rapa subsp. trilocularis TaxID=1813537 RepID=A0ABQ7NCY5_BRACM|nr:hypothetical protein IGI04_005071 [Brassica rapa subsp. trilocularis]